MAFLVRFLGFSSPQTKDQVLPMNPTPLKQDLKQRLDRCSMSPSARTRQWIIHTPDGSSESETPSILRVKGSKVVKRQQITPSSTRRSGASAKRQGASYWGLSWLTGKYQVAEYEEVDDEETLIEDDAWIEDQELDEDQELIVDNTLVADDALTEDETSDEYEELDEDEELLEDEEMSEDEELIQNEELIEDAAPVAHTPSPNYLNGAGNDTTLIPDDFDEDEEMSEDEELIEDEAPAAHTPSPNYLNGAGNDATLIADDSDEDDYVGELSKAEKKEYFLDIEDERTRRQKMLKQTETGDRTPEEIALFEKLTMRGFEPIVPRNWMMDFKTLPETMFTNDDSEIFINAASGNEFRATKALYALISLGVRARDRLIRSLTPEETLGRGIESYIKWSERDGNISRNDESHIPILTIGAAKPGESVASVVGRVTNELHSLGSRYREKWLMRKSIEGREELDEEDTLEEITSSDDVRTEDRIGEEFSHDLPTLYGIVIKHTVVAIVTYDVCVPGQEVRSIAMFDFGKPDQDVWNGLAVAILVITCRNYLMDLAAEEEAERPSADEEEEDDYDA